MANGQELAGSTPQQVQAAPGNVQGGNQQQILQAIEQALMQAVDADGYVDIRKLAQIWPQVAQQLGLNIPFQTVLQMLEQNPGLIEDIVSKLGLMGIVVDGRRISAEELVQMGSGAAGAPQGQVQTGGM